MRNEGGKEGEGGKERGREEESVKEGVMPCRQQTRVA